MTVPRATIVIATRNRLANLMPTLGRLCTLPERPPLILVDNRSTDGTPEQVRRHFPAVRVVALAANRGAAARTEGARRAATPYVAFSDDDSWWQPGALSRAADLLDAHPRLALVAARVLVGPHQRLDPTCAAMAASPVPAAPGLPGPAVLGFLACGAVVRRSAFLAVGGFHRHYGIGGEEELLALDLAAAGWDLAYVADVVAYHCPTPNGDRSGRRRVQLRNALWSTWLRRPLGSAVRRTARLVLPAFRDPDSRAGVVEALKGLPWVARQRRPVPPAVERGLRALGS